MLGAVAAALVAVSTGCGEDNKKEAAAPGAGGTDATAASESAYCDAAREWAIHEMTPFDDMDPAAFRAYWNDFVAFEEEAIATAPDAIRDDWVLKFEKESDTITPVLEKYDFNLSVMMESSTPEEEAAFDAPPDVQAAQDRILTYESEVCGAQQPLAADVSHAGEEPGPYCELVAAQDELAAEALASGDPAEVEAAFDELEAGSANLTDAAPAVIEDDVADLAVWVADRQRPVAEKFGYDLAEAIRNGTPQERADLNYADDEIRDQFARIVAYEVQVCGAE